MNKFEYIKYVRRIIVLFQIKQPDLSMVWLAVSEEGVTVLELASMSVIGRYALNSIGLFGGLQDDLMMLIDAEDATSPVHKMLISLNKPKVSVRDSLLVRDRQIRAQLYRPVQRPTRRSDDADPHYAD